MIVGVGTKLDIAKGIQYYGLAAIQGDVVAQYVLICTGRLLPRRDWSPQERRRRCGAL
jgi:hypothetical protein